MDNLATAGILLLAAYVPLILAFTFLGITLAPVDSQVGGVRSSDAIPGHIAVLFAFGVLIGGAMSVIYGREGVLLVILTPVLVTLLDLDHLPVYIGFSQPIRPAHSFVFVVTAVIATAIILRRLDLELVLVSSILAHLGVDSGLFAPFSPLSFDYVQLDPYRPPLLFGSFVFAILAALLWRRTKRSGGVAT